MYSRKLFLPILALSALAFGAIAAHAQNVGSDPVRYNPDTKRLDDDIKVGSGKTATVESGGTLVVAPGGTLNVTDATITGATKSHVGLNNVPNVDATDARNITRGVLRTSDDWLLSGSHPSRNSGEWSAWMIGGAPTMSQSSTSTITGPEYVETKIAEGASIYPEWADFLGATYSWGTGYPDGETIRPFGITGLNTTMPTTVEFYTDADAFEIITKTQATGGRHRLWVNGRLVSEAGIVPGGAAGDYPRYDKATFSSARVRLIQFESYSAYVRSIKVPTGFRIWKPSGPLARRPIVVYAGDSLGEGAGGRFDFAGAASKLARKFNWNLFNVSVGSTGYNANGTAGRVNLLSRVGDVIARNADLVIIAMGINDTSVSNAGPVYDRILAGSPAAKLVVIGSFWPNFPGDASKVAINATLAAECAARGIPFIDPIAPGKEWITGSNRLAYHLSTAATGTASLTGNAVSSVTVTNGSAYNNQAPTVSFSGGGGTGATGTAVLDGRVLCADILSGGRGYTTAPTVTISRALGDTTGTGATATCTTDGDAITSITITNPGTGYTRKPNISFSGVANAGGAVAVAGHSYVVSSVTVTNGGSGYTSAPTVTFSAASDGTHPKDAGHAYYAERIAWAIEQLFGGAPSPIY